MDIKKMCDKHLWQTYVMDRVGRRTESSYFSIDTADADIVTNVPEN